MELIEEMTLVEQLNFQAEFKRPIMDFHLMIEKFGYKNIDHKQLSQFSSGMKQRVKLMLSIYFENEVIYLDEPTSNLDSTGIEWYQNEMQTLIGKRTILIASNQRYEYDFCPNSIQL